jgi:hypothetical protein
MPTSPRHKTVKPPVALGESTPAEIARWLSDIDMADLVAFQTRLYTLERLTNQELRARRVDLRNSQTTA